MKLIDLLVQELPKRGGWPKDAEGAVQDKDDTEIYFFSGKKPRICGDYWSNAGNWIFTDWKNEMSDDWDSAIVSREQYEASLAASKQPEWSGEGLPPVGTICQARKLSKNDKNPAWVRVQVLYTSEFTVVMIELEEGARGEEVHHPATLEFRPMIKEDIRREDAVYELQKASMRARKRYEVGQVIWEHIAEGRIPGIRIE